LAEDRPTGGGVTEGVRRAFDVAAIAEAACAAESMQELLIGLKRWQFGKHPTVSCGAKRCIDCHVGSRRRQAVISNRGGGLIHEFVHSNVALRTGLLSFLNAR
jgi:hypothetical protein